MDSITGFKKMLLTHSMMSYRFSREIWTGTIIVTSLSITQVFLVALLTTPVHCIEQLTIRVTELKSGTPFVDFFHVADPKAAASMASNSLTLASAFKQFASA